MSEKIPRGFSIFVDIAGFIGEFPFSQFVGLSYQDDWKDVWQTLEKIGRMTMDCGDLWMDVKRSQGKKRALSELLKLLESSGLHRHKFEIMEVIDTRLHFLWFFGLLFKFYHIS